MFRLPEKCGCIIFDLDGTLWDASLTTVATWPIVFRNNPGVEPAFEMSHENVAKYMGLNNEELGRVFFPHLDSKRQAELMKESCDLENSLLYENGGQLYDGCDETIRKLSEKFSLFIVSNCQSGYIECFLHAHGFEGIFTDIECSGDTGLSKAENIKLICERNEAHNPVYVGDTTSDSKASEGAGVPFIYARYGFGEKYMRGKVEKYTFFIDGIDELDNLVSAE